jgi:hypothetical protein
MWPVDHLYLFPFSSQKMENLLSRHGNELGMGGCVEFYSNVEAGLWEKKQSISPYLAKTLLAKYK